MYALPPGAAKAGYTSIAKSILNLDDQLISKLTVKYMSFEGPYDE